MLNENDFAGGIQQQRTLPALHAGTGCPEGTGRDDDAAVLRRLLKKPGDFIREAGDVAESDEPLWETHQIGVGRTGVSD